MTEESFPEGNEGFSPEPDRTEGGSRAQDPEDFASSFAPPEGASSDGLDASFALTMAKTWIKDHQTKAMLGAFATGVVLGSMLRK